MNGPRILVMAGSLRSDSVNKKLARLAGSKAEAAGGMVTLIDLRDFPMPVYDGDLEASDGIPAHGLQLKTLFREHQGLIIASPEYNSSITAVLKNAIDWVSRPQPGEPPLVAFTGKVALLLSASPGNLGGLRGLVHLRSILGNIGVLVLPEQLAISQAYGAFEADGSLKDSRQNASLEAITRRLVELVRKVHAG
jgi:NAD(P)H-dependent FMN reductase